MVPRNPLLSAKEICMIDLKCGLLKVLAKEQIGCECSPATCKRNIFRPRNISQKLPKGYEINDINGEI